MQIESYYNFVLSALKFKFLRHMNSPADDSKNTLKYNFPRTMHFK